MDNEFEIACDKAISIDWIGQNVLLFASVDKATAFFDDIGIGERPCGDGGAGTLRHAESGSVLYYMIFRHEAPDIRVIVHECSHVVDYIVDDLGFPVGREGTEPRAYLLDWLVAQVMAFYGLRVMWVGVDHGSGDETAFSVTGTDEPIRIVPTKEEASALFPFKSGDRVYLVGLVEKGLGSVCFVRYEKGDKPSVNVLWDDGFSSNHHPDSLRLLQLRGEPYPSLNGITLGDTVTKKGSDTEYLVYAQNSCGEFNLVLTDERGDVSIGWLDAAILTKYRGPDDPDRVSRFTNGVAVGDPVSTYCNGQSVIGRVISVSIAGEAHVLVDKTGGRVTCPVSAINRLR